MPPSTELVQFHGAAHPLKAETTSFAIPEGATLQEMLEMAQPDPMLLRDATVFIGDMEISRDYWHVVRPKAGQQVTARVVPYLRGGGGGGGKNPLRTILTIAVIAAAFFLGPALGAALGIPETAVIAGQTINLASAVGGAIITVAGTLIINAIAPIRPPKLPELSGGAGVSQESPSLFLDASSNQARPFDPIPSLLGYFRYRPPQGAQTYTEVLGDKNRLRMLLLPGLGQIQMTNWRIGNTDIAEFSDYTLETREGTSGDADLTVYTNTVDQDDFSILLEQANGFTQRTSGDNADSLSVDITHPSGLVTFDSNGNRGNRSVVVEINYRKVGDVTWLNPPSTAITTAGSYDDTTGEWTISGAKSGSVRNGIRWDVAEQAQYEVRVQRVTTDTTSTSIFDLTYWSALRAFTNADPITMPVPVAKAGLDILSTDQLNGLLQDLNVYAQSYVAKSWNRDTMVWDDDVVSNNPADLYRHVLQGPGKAVAVPDSEIDLDTLQDWHEFCEDNGFTFNMVRDFNASVWDTLADIASAGRAGMDVIDGKWSVVIDQPQSITVTHITPRNSFGFEVEKHMEEVPHAWRIRFPNEEQDFQQDERIVYRDGFNADGSGGDTQATLFQSLFFPGVTHPDHVWKLGRYHGAVAVNRPERWTVYQDFEYLVARRGNRVKVTHDVLSVGLSSGRIKTVNVNGGGDATDIVIDTPAEMTTGNNYGVVIRRDVSGDVSLSAQVNTADGSNTSLVFTTPIPAASIPEVGDLYSFGLLDQETEDALVLLIDEQSEFVAKITLVPYRAAIYSADDGPVPTYTPTVTAPVFLPTASIVGVTSDESVMEEGAGDVALVRAEFRVTPIEDSSAQLEVQQRFSGTSESWYNSELVKQTREAVKIGGVTTGETWDFRVRWNDESRLPGPWTYAYNHTIVGNSTDPDPLQNATISVFGGQVLIRWDEPRELDVQFGGEVRFRHSDTGTGWNESVSIGQAAKARSLFATLPLKAGTYFGRVFDKAGNKSTVVELDTEQASVLTYANVDTLDEATSFSGTHTNTIAIDGDLKLDSAGLFDDVGDVDALASFDSLTGVQTSGTYEFNSGFDLGTKKKVRLTTRVTAVIELAIDSIDDRLDLIDTWEDFDGTDQAEADCQVWVRYTDDDPAGSPTWSDFERLDSAEFDARGFDFEARLSSNSASYNILVSELGVDAEEVS